MPRGKRNYKKYSYYHVYNRCNNKEPLIRNPADKQLFVNLLYKFLADVNLKLTAFCIMDTHFHLIVRTREKPTDISTYMRKVVTSFSMQINRKYQRVGHIFQGRYNAKLLYWKKDLHYAIEYIKQNPVKEGMVKKASDYPWSKY